MTAGKPHSDNADADGAGDTEFARWFTAAAERAGYDVHRHGWKSKLARDSGQSPSSIGRFARGAGKPTPDASEALARQLGIPITEVMVKAGLLTPDGAKRAAGGKGLPDTLTPAERRFHALLHSMPADDPIRRRLERQLADITEAGEERAKGAR
jgi:transcriptional regulator with XRE-family HTH domain